MEVKQVDGLQRVISGYAAVIGNIDLGNDIIEPGAFTKTLQRKQPSEIGVFIGHDTSSLPVGIPIVLRVDGKGLYSETLVKPGPVGDDLLATAQFMAAHGRPLGQSIGYRVAPGGAAMDRVNGKTVRRLREIDLHEYSFAAGMAVMNPEALTTGVKTGAGMYRVKEMDGRWHVMRDEKSLADYATEDEARAKVDALKADDGKTLPNTLPDSAFLYIAPGGVLDDEGKTVPRTNRHFRFRDAAGSLDAEALAVTLTEIPQAKAVIADDRERARLAAHARRLSEAEAKTADAPEWRSETALDLLSVAYGLIDAVGVLTEQHKALAVVGQTTNNGRRMPTEMREQIERASKTLAAIAEQALLVEQGKDAEALADWWQAQFSLLEVAS